MTENSFWELRLLALLVAIGLIVAVGIYQFIIYSSTKHQGRRSAGAMASMLVAVALVLLEKDVTLALSRWTGLNNIGWYLGYLFGALGCYLFAQIAYLTDVHQYGPLLHRRLRVIVVGLLVLLTFIYVTHLMQMPEWPERTPRTGWELLFSVTYFIYCFGIVVAVALTVWQSRRREENPAQRLRLWFALVGNGAGLLCFIGKLVYLTLYYFGIEWLWLDNLAMLALAAAGFWFCLSVTPGWFLRLLVSLNPVVHIRQIWVLFWVSRLAAQLYGLMPAMSHRHAHIHRQLHSAPLYIYQTLIAILDGQRDLAGCLAMEPERRRRVTGLRWTEHERKQAMELNQVLRQIDELGNAAYPTVVRSVVRISREIAGHPIK